MGDKSEWAIRMGDRDISQNTLHFRLTSDYCVLCNATINSLSVEVKILIHNKRIGGDQSTDSLTITKSLECIWIGVCVVMRSGR